MKNNSKRYQSTQPDLYQTITDQVISAIESGTELEVCINGSVKHVDIPRRHMVAFSAEVVHGGSAYTKENYRVFWKVVPAARAHDVAKMSQDVTEKLEWECTHNELTKTQKVTLMICTLLFVIR